VREPTTTPVSASRDEAADAPPAIRQPEEGARTHDGEADPPPVVP
jgi:hypothetical protein